jgi:purine-nucleoside phosphorylase
MKSVSPQLAAARLLKLSPLRPKLAIILGTGFSGALNGLESEARVSYGKIPGFPPVGVAGHPGELVIGRLAGEALIVLRGRAHSYEGHSMSSVTFGVRVLAACGIHDLLLTNAAGGINPEFGVGDFMAIEDHINFMATNPLLGPAVSNLPRFVDLSQVYDRGLLRLLRRAAKAGGIHLRLGVYLAVSGPSYETPAEIRAFRSFGADAVGMSTVPEAIVARQCGLRVAGLSCITNLAAGLSKTPLSHREVLETASRAQVAAGKMLSQFVALYGRGNKVSD